MQPQIDEERLASSMPLLNEGDRVLRILVYRHLFTRTIEGAISIKAVLAGRRRVRDHVIGQVPFAEMRRSIAAIFQDPGQERGPGVKPIRHIAPGIARHPGEMAINIVTRRKMPGHHRRTAGGTDPAGNGKPMKVSSLPGQAINIGRLHLGVTMAAQVPPAPVISKNEEDIGWHLLRGSQRKQPKNERKENTCNSFRIHT